MQIARCIAAEDAGSVLVPSRHVGLVAQLFERQRAIAENMSHEGSHIVVGRDVTAVVDGEALDDSPCRSGIEEACHALVFLKVDDEVRDNMALSVECSGEGLLVGTDALELNTVEVNVGSQRTADGVVNAVDHSGEPLDIVCCSQRIDALDSLDEGLVGMSALGAETLGEVVLVLCHLGVGVREAGIVVGRAVASQRTGDIDGTALDEERQRSTVHLKALIPHLAAIDLTVQLVSHLARGELIERDDLALRVDVVVLQIEGVGQRVLVACDSSRIASHGEVGGHYAVLYRHVLATVGIAEDTTVAVGSGCVDDAVEGTVADGSVVVHVGTNTSGSSVATRIAGQLDVADAVFHHGSTTRTSKDTTRARVVLVLNRTLGDEVLDGCTVQIAEERRILLFGLVGNLHTVALSVERSFEGQVVVAVANHHVE